MMRTPRFWYHQTALSPVLETALMPFSKIYKFFSLRRIAKKTLYNAQTPVICVGNITAGGTGKTPVVGAFADIFLSMKQKPHILSRGYGGRAKGTMRVDTKLHVVAEVGDEAMMHAKNYATWISRKRADGGRMIDIHGNATVILMDDGFQNPDLHKDISIIVIDGRVGFGNKKTIPAGPLREPIDNGLKRADAVVIMGDDMKFLKERFGYLMPVFQARLVPDFDKKKWEGKKVVGFSGIGRPEKFRQTLLSLDVKLKDFIPFADHHMYSERDIQNLIAKAKPHNAHLVTTEKDWVRLPMGYQSLIKPIPVKIEWQDEAAIHAFLKEKLGL